MLRDASMSRFHGIWSGEQGSRPCVRGQSPTRRQGAPSHVGGVDLFNTRCDPALYYGSPWCLRMNQQLGWMCLLMCPHSYFDGEDEAGAAVRGCGGSGLPGWCYSSQR